MKQGAFVAQNVVRESAHIFQYGKTNRIYVKRKKKRFNSLINQDHLPTEPLITKNKVITRRRQQKRSITQRFWTILERSMVITTVTKLVWFIGVLLAHSLQQLCNPKDKCVNIC